MPKICYVKKRFSESTKAIIDKANEIISEYEAQGFDLTLRQIFYQFVSRDILPNSQKSYKNLGSIINDARLAGLIDWLHITDRTRNLRRNSHFTNPADVIRAAECSYKIDMWANQTYRPEVWIEKDALVGVIEGVCNELDVPYFSCRGYTSQSEMWIGAQRMEQWIKAEPSQVPVVFHFGDHDPSGKDMTRDITDRLELFMGGIRLERLALNMAQIEQYDPPPNPAKLTDARAEGYIAEFGDESWELDALEPQVIVDLIRTHVEQLQDKDKWQEDVARHAREKALLNKTAGRWPEIEAFLERPKPPKKRKGK